jgi:hypothetical protein
MTTKQVKTAIRAIETLRAEGLTYKQVDAQLDLPFKAYRFMNMRMVRRLRGVAKSW